MATTFGMRAPNWLALSWSHLMTLIRQLEELHLIQCSLFSGELLIFLDEYPKSQSQLHWVDLLVNYPDSIDPLVENASIDAISEAYFKIKLDNAGSSIWLEIMLPRSYPGSGSIPAVFVKGNLSRSEQERWQSILRDKIEAVRCEEFMVYELISTHLLPLLHTEYDNANAVTAGRSESPTHESRGPQLVSATRYHALLTSHHLISPQKRRSLHQWSSDLNVKGFAKVGYPGIIYAGGLRKDVEEFVGNVKAMQWLALRVRFIEALSHEKSEVVESEKSKWMEFEKVGEVVEEMKRIGREECVLHIGIGSGGR